MMCSRSKQSDKTQRRVTRDKCDLWERLNSKLTVVFYFFQSPIFPHLLSPLTPSLFSKSSSGKAEALRVSSASHSL